MSQHKWLGEIPEHWEVRAIKHLARPGRKTFVDGDWIEIPYITEEGVRLIQTGNVGIGEYREKGFKYVSEETFHSLKCTEVEPGNVLICRLDGPVGRACLAPDLGVRMITSVDNTILKPAPEHDPRFIVYFLSCKPYLEWTQVLCRVGGGHRWRISRSMLGDLRVPVPPPTEQRQIASFLDRKTAAIDTLISKKQRLIQLLEEKRTALINQAVTKGLNPNVPMKDSGVPWIGEIPEHWEAKLFRRVTSRIDVGIAEAATHAYAEQGVPIVRSANVRTNYIDMSNLAYIQEEFAEKNRSKYIHAGDILTVRTGANAGMTAVVPEELNHVQCFTLLVATPVTQQVPQFYSYYINSPFAQSFFTVEGWGSAQVNLSVPILKELPIVEPPYQEQQKIVTSIQQSTKKIDELISKNQQIIKLLQEYRQSLISAAVTGKLDVGEENAA